MATKFICGHDDTCYRREGASRAVKVVNLFGLCMGGTYRSGGWRRETTGMSSLSYTHSATDRVGYLAAGRG
jgi:hypothetical protein